LGFPSDVFNRTKVISLDSLIFFVLGVAATRKLVSVMALLIQNCVFANDARTIVMCLHGTFFGCVIGKDFMRLVVIAFQRRIGRSLHFCLISKFFVVVTFLFLSHSLWKVMH